MSDTDRAAPEHARLLASVAVILGVLALRCLSQFDPFPYWSGDPFEAPAPAVSITPTVSAVLDTLTAFAAALAASAMHAGERRRLALSLIPAFLAVLAVAVHARSGASLDNVVYGSMLVSAFVSAATLFAAAARPRVRRIVLSVLLGLLGVLAARAVQQVFVEHPTTLRNFQATREQFFRAQGWTPDSPMARAFQRRLNQAEASGYFGMANAFATLGAAGLAATLGLVLATRVGTRPRGPRRTPLGIVVLVACAACIVWFAGAKGGFAAALLGAGAVAAGMLAARRGLAVSHRATRLVAPLVVLATLGAVIARGVVGTRSTELSILFRWFYMQASARIFADHPLLGVGPAGFKSAYLLAKSPLSPEEVTSPHSVLLDLVTTLGVAGVALAVLWMFWASLGAAGLFAAKGTARALPRTPPPPADDDPAEWKLGALILTLATIAAIALERATMTPDTALTRLAGLGLGVWTCISVVHVLHATESSHAQRVGVRVALGAAVLALAAHCQIELTGITPGATAWCLALLALAAGWDAPASPRAEHASHGLNRAPLITVALLALVVVSALNARRVITWQAALASAYEGTEPIAELTARRNALAMNAKLPGLEGDSTPTLARDLAAMLNARVDATPESVDRALAAVRLADATRALAEMPDAARPLPHFPTLRARSRLALIEAEAHAALGSSERARASIAAGAADLDAAESTFASIASYWAWVGTYQEAASELEARLAAPTEGEGASDAALAHTRASLAAWERTHALGPHELLPARKALAASERLGDASKTKRWAAECLRINDLLRMDPMEQMSAADAARCKSHVDK